MDFYDKFMSYGLDKNNKFNLDEVVDKIISELKLNESDKFKYIFKSIKRLSYEFYDIVSFFPFKLNLDQ